MIIQLLAVLPFMGVADEVSLCGAGTFEILDAATGLPTALPNPSKERVVALTDVGQPKSISIFENETTHYPPVRCSLRIEACASCLVNIRYKSPADSLTEQEIRELPSCYESLVDPCFDLRFVEERADSALDLTYRKWSIWDFPRRSETNSSGDSIIIMLTMRNISPNSSLQHYIENLFPLEIKSISNEVVVTGYPTDNVLSPNQTSIGFIESPRYPDAYPRSLVKKYTLVNTKTGGYIRLVFDDFHLHFQSEMQILDSDGHVLINTKSDHRRPPAILSSGNRLTLHFKAHDFTHSIGFRARYEFVHDKEWSDRPNGRDCDELHEGYGGEIKMDGNQQLVNTYVDCIWIVEEFHMKGVGLRLEVREGATSTSERLLLLFDSQTSEQLAHKQPRHGYTTFNASPAFYVRLRGYVMGSSGLEIVYSQFYRWATALCPGIGEFHCDNARCIKSTLRCDGINNCGDLSDEQCQRPVSDFKQNDTDVSGLIALVIGVCGLILLIISTTTVMGRFYRRRLTVRLNDSGLPRNSPYASDSTAPSMQTVGERRFYVVPESQVSVIEAPPSYDDALKHPAVPTSTVAYLNPDYVSTASEEQLPQSQDSEELPAEVPKTLRESQPDESKRQPPQSRSACVEEDGPCTSAQLPCTNRSDDDSWV
ncbi:hypothetical protein Q1695_009375 [Nippostrongylus brasiliensis]|nr:hypothetical protein Q1695_009375 [Nippostrongylus brasiliensis]